MRINKESFLSFYEKGLNDVEISKQIGCSNAAITYFRQRLKLPKNFKYKKNFNEEEYLSLYNKGISDLQISKILKVGKDSLRNFRISKNLPVVEFNYIPSNIEVGVLIGTLLGDGTLRNPKWGNVSGSFSHCLKQEEYCKYKYNILKNLCTSISNYESKIDKRTNKSYKLVYVNLKANRFLTNIYSLLYKNKIKYISKEILEHFSEYSLAILYMDDGFKATSGGYYIATNCFSIEELILFSKFLKNKWNINTSIHRGNKIYIKKESSKIFEKLISEHIIESMSYKLHKCPD